MDSKGSKRSVNGLPRTHPSKTMKLRNGVSAAPRMPRMYVRNYAERNLLSTRIKNQWISVRKAMAIHTILEPTATPSESVILSPTESITAVACSMSRTPTLSREKIVTIEVR
jgi:hypothetical protein